MSEDGVEDLALRCKHFLDEIATVADDDDLEPPMVFRLFGLYCKKMVEMHSHAVDGGAPALIKSVIENFMVGLDVETTVAVDIQDRMTVQ